MTPETADWLNRIGMILGFVSFWFVAPEFIGVQRLQKWDQALGKGLLKLPFVAKVAMIITTTGIVFIYIFRWIATGRTDTISTTQLLVMGLVASTMLFFGFIRDWIAARVSTLANNALIRQRSLFLGAALFTISFVVQLAATFQTRPLH